MEEKKGKSKSITIKRIATSDAGTFGVVLDDNIPFCVSCELPFKDNQKNISSIPSGYFEAMRVDSPRFGNTFEVKGGSLGDRTHILFHKGNSIKDSRGCILLAEGYGQKDHVERSRDAFNEFMKRTEGCDYFILRIIEDYR
jgi:hypothetical protein